MSGQGFEQVPGLLQLFVKYYTNESMSLLIAKAVHDFLAVGNLPLVQELHEAIS